MDDYIKNTLQAQAQKQRQARQRRNHRILAAVLTATAVVLGLACIIALAGAGYYLVRALNKPSPADSMKQKVTAIVQEFGGEVSFEEHEYGPSQ